ncbi:MAG TPA: alanine racemase [Candidatus Limnocylindrales bacterium]|nr:alanine racemase [Candidatus Limnocylindrales bacterium]
MSVSRQGEHFVWEPSGKASIDGHDLAELARKYPTPFYLISQGQLRDNYRRLRQAFASVEGLETYYSVKSNFESIVLRTLQQEGCGAEISGALDMELARRAGFSPSKVVFDGPCKPEADLRAAIEWGIRFINIESLTEARLISRIATETGKKVRVGMRIDPVLSKPYYDKVISTYKQKFGLPIDQAEAAIAEIAKMPGLDFRGIMTHIGSQIFTPSRYLVAMERIFDLVTKCERRGIHIEEINMGGGYPAQSMRNLRLSRRFVIAQVLERMGRIEVKTSSIDDFGKAISEKYHALVKSTGYSPRLALEPGRCLCANAQTVVGQMRIVKNDWLFTDISINDVPENLFFSEWRLVVPGEKPDAKGRPYNVAGPTLATQDVLYFKREVPGAAEGRAVVIMDAGAYSVARSNQFTRPRSAVYAINLEGDIELVRRAETVEDVLRSQIWPEESAAPASKRVA